MADDDAAQIGRPENAVAAAEPAFNLVEFLKSTASRMFFFYLAMSAVRTFFAKPQNSPSLNSTAAAAGSRAALNFWPPNQNFDFHFYLAPTETADFGAATAAIWSERDLRYGDWNSGAAADGARSKTLRFATPPNLQRNESLFLHVFFVRAGRPHLPNAPNYVAEEVVYGVFRLNKFKKKHYKLTSNLLTGKTEKTAEEQKKATEMKYEILNFWHPNITVNLVHDHTAWTPGQVPSPLDQYVKFRADGNSYFPILFFNNYWNLGSEYQPVNETVKQLNLTITYSPLSLFKWQLYASQQSQSKWSQMLGGAEGGVGEEDDDHDTIKQALLETSPWLLGITIVVSIAHTILEFLAFKNDIQFWRTRKSLEGLSVRSVLFNFFQSIIVFLYICDNDSSFVIKCSIGVGLLIELWKIPKVMNVEIVHAEKYFGLIPKLRISDKGTYVESSTKIYDQLAFKYLSWLLYPLLGGYAIYSLIYEEQRGWYSWVLSMLYGFLLMFGFIMMTPQLFINYKLKSVAHLPWRMLTYKFINTFIDDLFAFVIRMPTMYRIGCFRDDIIFLVYIYQRWIYRVDPTRVNEFGTSMEKPDEVEDAIPPGVRDPTDRSASTASAEAAASGGSAVEAAAEQPLALESKKDK